jgi:chaperonin GroEL (HSP60 family)
MLKMLLDPMGGIVLTNDGHAILREIEVSHPAAKSMIELSRTQDEEVGDGTTTVIILGMTPSTLLDELYYGQSQAASHPHWPHPPYPRTDDATVY